MNVTTQATLPEGLSDADHSIASMEVGDAGWTVPWAMFTDEERRLWLNGKYTLHHRPGGTVQMKVRRDRTGWHVDASKCDEKRWGGGRYVGGALPIPVATFAS